MVESHWFYEDVTSFDWLWERVEIVEIGISFSGPGLERCLCCRAASAGILSDTLREVLSITETTDVPWDLWSESHIVQDSSSLSHVSSQEPPVTLRDHALDHRATRSKYDQWYWYRLMPPYIYPNSPHSLNMLFFSVNIFSLLSLRPWCPFCWLFSAFLGYCQNFPPDEDPPSWQLAPPSLRRKWSIDNNVLCCGAWHKKGKLE